MEMQAYFSSTWKVVGREWILHLIDVGLKLINFELNDETKQKKERKKDSCSDQLQLQTIL